MVIKLVVISLCFLVKSGFNRFDVVFWSRLVSI